MDLEAKEKREKIIAAEYRSFLYQELISRLLLPTDICAAIDIACGIDKKSILAKELKEFILFLEKSTIADLQNTNQDVYRKG